MHFFIHKIVTGKSDELSHLHFEKFSKGEFKNRAVVQCKNSPKGYSISTTGEYANELVRYFAGKLGDSKANVTGAIISTKGLPASIKYKNISQFMGVKKYSIEGEMSGRQITEICDSVPRAFLGLSFSFGGNELKIKPKAPKSAKPSSSSDDKELKVDFCKIKTTDSEIVKDLFFDISDFKQAEAKHTFLIENIELPSNESDPIKMRERAIRKGKIVRELTVDGIKTKKDYVFSA